MTGDHGHPWTVGPARPEEWIEAFSILFQRVPGAEQTVRVRNAVTMARRGEFPPAGIIVARSDRLVGVILCLPLAGAGGLIELTYAHKTA